MQRPSFLDQKPPPGYIPGIGRGATGFSTRGDQNKNVKTPRRLRPDENGSQGLNHANDNEEAFTNEDVEAEAVFAAIETKLSTRRKRPQGTNEEDLVNQIPKQFADLKRSLATMSEEDWLNLPDAGDLTRKNKRERLQDQLHRKEYAAPDTLVNRGVNLTKLTEERERLLGRQLDSNLVQGLGSDSIAAGNNVAGYLNELDSLTVNNLDNADEAEEANRMRAVLSSYRKADPTRAEGWIASARLEEKACKFRRAKNIMEEACATCPKNDELWLERIRLNASDSVLCRALVAEGIRFNPKSLLLWTKATELETESFNKRRVIMKALQELPTSEELWKQIIVLESDEKERQRILHRAVELVPTSIDLWKQLVELQDYMGAKASLNTARKHLPTDYQVWILAAQVEERANKGCTMERLKKLLVSGMSQLRKINSNPGLSEWLNCSQTIDNEGVYPKVAIAIVEAAFSMESLKDSSSRAIKVTEDLEDSFIKVIAYRVLLNDFPTNHGIWRSLRTTCLKVGRQELLYEIYDDILFNEAQDYKALKDNPTLSLIYAKEVWKYGKNTSKALEILDKSIDLMPEYLDLWIAKLKVLCFSSQFEEAMVTFQRAFGCLSNSEIPHLERLYVNYVSFLRFQSQYQKAIDFLEQDCLKKFPDCYKFYVQMGQTHRDMRQLKQMRESYSLATKKLPHCSLPWIMLAKADEIVFKNAPRARSELDIALLKNPQDETLYLAKIEMECREGFHDQARLLVLQALQIFPNSAKIWVENIKLIPSKRASTKKTVFQDALRNTKNNSLVLNEIGLSFIRDAQHATAVKWLERATKSNPKLGDAWVWLARCLKILNKDVNPIYEQVEEHEPTLGPLWISVAKDMRYQYLNPSKILKQLLEQES